MSTIRLWITIETTNLTPAEVRSTFIQAIRDAIRAAEQQGRLEHAIAQQLRWALERRREPTE